MAWTWNTWGGNEALVSDYGGTPTSWGKVWKAQLASVGPAPPRPPAPPPPPAPPGPATCEALLGMQCDGDDLHDAGPASSADDCCGKCLATTGCVWWTYNRGYDKHCWLKNKCSNLKRDSKCDSGTVGALPPGPPPAAVLP
jgi:hypothetical protein